MARSAKPPKSSAASYHGEIWTDGRGYATVHLPAEAGRMLPPVTYELRDLEPPSTARVIAELEQSRFTIATDQPHVKVGWRISCRLASGAAHQQTEEGEER